MSLLEGDLAGIFRAAFGDLYLNGSLYRPIDGDDGAGGGAGGGFGSAEPVKAQIDQATQAMRSAEGFVDSDQRIIVLASGVDPITTDCEIVAGGTRWSIATVMQDPARSYYELRGRRISDA